MTISKEQALKIAVLENDIQKVKRLIESGLNINQSFEYGTSVLHLATLDASMFSIAKYLIEQGADINFRNAIGSTVLISAARNNNALIVKLLLDSGAEVNSKDQYADTALSHALKHGFESVAKILREYGAKDLEGEN